MMIIPTMGNKSYNGPDALVSALIDPRYVMFVIVS